MYSSSSWHSTCVFFSVEWPWFPCNGIRLLLSTAVFKSLLPLTWSVMQMWILRSCPLFVNLRRGLFPQKSQHPKVHHHQMGSVPTGVLYTYHWFSLKNSNHTKKLFVCDDINIKDEIKYSYTLLEDKYIHLKKTTF